MFNTTQTKFETIRTLELLEGTKKDILEIVDPGKIIWLTSKELELIYCFCSLGNKMYRR